MIFQHEGFRALWPVVFFLPWFLVGVAYLVAAMVHGRREASAPSVPVRHRFQVRQAPPALAPRLPRLPRANPNSHRVRSSNRERYAEGIADQPAARTQSATPIPAFCL